MQTIQAPRASAILYNLLVSRKQTKPWLLPANICPIVPITFMKARIPFEFVDISPESLRMDLNQAEARIKTREVGGLLYAHTYGDESTPGEFFAQAKALNPEMWIVDDRCLCIPKFETVSSADVVLFSAGYAKIVDLGGGGYAFLKDEIPCQPVSLPFSAAQLAELEEAYKFAVRERVRFEYTNSNWLMTDADLPVWDEFRRKAETNLKEALSHRKALNAIYASRLPNAIQLPAEFQTWRFNIRAKNQLQVIKEIFAAGLFASAHYASLAGIMSDGKAPVAEALADDVINLFNDQHFTSEMAEHACEIILKTARW
ncbi:MAG: DegT/DnrJ/EryC1/StrS aminotransferase family protein [Anaerolineales bacterium]|nr:DegT/DnrJ/EryC1/StrS aminotransferase family protein [Anaerolineales bacterium]